ncbi:MAG: hypothetical protein JSV23_00380 [Promethearchaeota archaeon]|nr:MAG: hypothetical protein JSV23_00380 [Candidatus Lokiarchaeota archaeon]
MNLIFFIKSVTADIDNYTIKDIPGSTGRLDVISRCVLSAILGKDSFEKNIQIWVFLDRYGTFIFNPEFLNNKIFPKNELLFSDYFVEFLQSYSVKEKKYFKLFSSIKVSKMSIIEAIKHFRTLNYNLYILHEQGQNFFELLNNIQGKEKILFIIGSQDDEFLKSKELLELKIPTISLGNQSYLASSVIRLLKLHLLAL